METDQAEQLDALLRQSTKALHKIWDTEETNVFIASKYNNKSTSSFKNQDT